MSTGKKVATDENNKTNVSTNEMKTSSTKQQKAPVHVENVEGKKQSKTSTSNKQQTSEKGMLSIDEFKIYFSSHR